MTKQIVPLTGGTSSKGNGSYIHYNGRVERVFGNNDSKCSSPSSITGKPTKSSGQEPSTRDKVKKEAKKETSRKSIQMLQGSLNIVPDLDFKTREVYTLSGLESVFDGNYYVEQCTHSITKGGYAISATVIKVDKASLEYYKGSRRTETTNKISTKKHSPKSGETTKSIAKKYNTSEDTIKSLNNTPKRGSHNVYISCPY